MTAAQDVAQAQGMQLWGRARDAGSRRAALGLGLAAGLTAGWGGSLRGISAVSKRLLGTADGGCLRPATPRDIAAEADFQLAAEPWGFGLLGRVGVPAAAGVGQLAGALGCAPSTCRSAQALCVGVTAAACQAGALVGVLVRAVGAVVAGALALGAALVVGAWAAARWQAPAPGAHGAIARGQPAVPEAACSEAGTFFTARSSLSEASASERLDEARGPALDGPAFARTLACLANPEAASCARLEALEAAFGLYLDADAAGRAAVCERLARAVPAARGPKLMKHARIELRAALLAATGDVQHLKALKALVMGGGWNAKLLADSVVAHGLPPMLAREAGLERAFEYASAPPAPQGDPTEFGVQRALQKVEMVAQAMGLSCAPERAAVEGFRYTVVPLVRYGEVAMLRGLHAAGQLQVAPDALRAAEEAWADRLLLSMELGLALGNRESFGTDLLALQQGVTTPAVRTRCDARTEALCDALLGDGAQAARDAAGVRIFGSWRWQVVRAASREAR